MNIKHVRLLASVGFAAFLCGGSLALAATAPTLGTAETFAVLGGSTVTNVPSVGTVLTGDLGVWPGLAITGFPPGIVTGTTHAGDAVAQTAQGDVTAAYLALAGQTCNTVLTGQDLGGMTLTPGAYCFSTSAQLTGTLTLNAGGHSDAVFVFQIGSTLTTASNSSVSLINSAQSCNVFWQVGSSATLGTGTTFAGNILALTSITLNTNASMTGRALARNGAVTLDTNNVNVSPCAPVCPAITLAPATLPTGVQPGVPYTATITATGGTGPYTFAVTAGTLPPGSPAFTLTSSGPSSALLSGTPTTAGTWTFTITATDSNNCPGSQPYTITVNPLACPTLTILPATLPNAVVGSPYSQPITASGSTPDTYVYTVTAGLLPPGLALNPVTPPATKTVSLSGTPTTTGNYSFTITATDANGCHVSQAYTILVNPAPCPQIIVSPAILPNPSLNIFYSQTISASGGTGSYTFTVTAGALPPLLTLNPNTGIISGMPTTAGIYSFTITATDANGCPGTRDYTITIPPPTCPTLTILPTTLPDAVVGSLYSQPITASGGTSPYTFTMTAGSLPPGLKLTSNGPSSVLLSGTPTKTGIFSFTVTATDFNNCPVSQAYTILVIPASCPQIIVSPTTLPSPTVGSPYSQLISASGGTGSYIFTVTAGALPPLLTLNPNTGVISGMSTTAGNYSFTITATDGNNCPGAQAYTMLIVPPENIPTLSGWAMIMLVALLALLGFAVIRRLAT